MSKVISEKKDVEDFLCNLVKVLNSSSFNIDTDLDILMRKKLESPTDPYTTFNTIQELGLDREDIVHHLKSLNISDYLETVIDDKNSSWPPFFAFAKSIDNKDVYIKVKIRDITKGKVFCVSFHFARYPLPKTLPYA